MRVGDLADGGPGFDGGDDRRHEVARRRAPPATRRRSAARQRRRRGWRAAPAPARSAAASMSGSTSGKRLGDRLRRVPANWFTPTTMVAPRVDGALRAVRGFLNLALDEAAFDGRQRAAGLHRSARAAPSRRCSMSSVSALDRLRAADRIDRVRDAAFRRDDLLRAQRNSRRLLGRQRQRLVAAVAVQRLRAAEHRRQRLQRDADDVVVGLLRGQRAAGGLRVKAQLLRARMRRVEPVAHDARPQPPRRAKLRDLLEEIVVRVEEERQRAGRTC